MNKSTVTVHLAENCWEEVQRALTDLIFVYQSASKRDGTPDFAKGAQERRLRALKKVRKNIAKQI